MVLRPRSPCLCVLSGPAGNLLTCRGSAQVSPSCPHPQGGRETSWHSSGACTQLLYVTIPSHCPTPSTMPTLTRSSWATNPHLKDGLLRLRRASHMLGLGTQCPARQQEPQKSWWPAQEMQWPTADWLRGLQALLRKCMGAMPRRLGKSESPRAAGVGRMGHQRGAMSWERGSSGCRGPGGWCRQGLDPGQGLGQGASRTPRGRLGGVHRAWAVGVPRLSCEAGDPAYTLPSPDVLQLQVPPREALSQLLGRQAAPSPGSAEAIPVF